MLYFAAGAWVSVIGALVACTIAVLALWASVGTCLGSLVGLFVVLLDGGTSFDSQAAVSVLFGVIIAAAMVFSWCQAREGEREVDEWMDRWRENKCVASWLKQSGCGI